VFWVEAVYFTVAGHCDKLALREGGPFQPRVVLSGLPRRVELPLIVLLDSVLPRRVHPRQRDALGMESRRRRYATTLRRLLDAEYPFLHFRGGAGVPPLARCCPFLGCGSLLLFGRCGWLRRIGWMKHLRLGVPLLSRGGIG